MLYQTRCSECGSNESQKRYELRVLSTKDLTSTPIAKARSNRRATTEATALEWKPRYATNAVKPAAVNSAGVPKTDHRLVRLDLVFKVCAKAPTRNEPRIDRPF